MTSGMVYILYRIETAFAMETAFAKGLVLKRRTTISIQRRWEDADQRSMGSFASLGGNVESAMSALRTLKAGVGVLALAMVATVTWPSSCKTTPPHSTSL